MKYRLLELLRCPVCRESVTLHALNTIEDPQKLEWENSPRILCSRFCGLKQIAIPQGLSNPSASEWNCSACYQKEIVDGVLSCSCGNLYPIIDSVPRLIEGNLMQYEQFITKYRDTVKHLFPHIAITENENKRQAGLDSEYEKIRKSFSKEWSTFEYNRDKTWGWTIPERKKVFLNEIQLKEEQLSGKLLLDAGCGNGTMCAALSDFGMEVIGIDLHDGLPKAQREKSQYALRRPWMVHYVQANLAQPPLVKEAVDLLYSSGVIHHTPNSKNTFNQLAPLLKKGGRMFVWVYGERGILVRWFQDSGRELKKIISLKTLYGFCRFLAPFYHAAANILKFLGITEFRPRSTREIALDLFDAFSPTYNHRHKPEEVKKWFEENRFTNIQVSGIQKHGFGVFGDKPKDL